MAPMTPDTMHFNPDSMQIPSIDLEYLTRDEARSACLSLSTLGSMVSTYDKMPEDQPVHRDYRFICPMWLQKELDLQMWDRPKLDTYQILRTLYWNFKQNLITIDNKDEALNLAALKLGCVINGYYNEDQAVTSSPRRSFSFLGQDTDPLKSYADRTSQTGSASLMASYIKSDGQSSYKDFLTFLLQKDRLEEVRYCLVYVDQFMAMYYLLLREFGTDWNRRCVARMEAIWGGFPTIAKFKMIRPETILPHLLYVLGIKILHEKFHANLEGGKLAATFELRAKIPPKGMKGIVLTNLALNCLKDNTLTKEIAEELPVQVEKVQKQYDNYIKSPEAMSYHREFQSKFESPHIPEQAHWIMIACSFSSKYKMLLDAFQRNQPGDSPPYASFSRVQQASLNVLFRYLQDRALRDTMLLPQSGDGFVVDLCDLPRVVRFDLAAEGDPNIIPSVSSSGSEVSDENDDEEAEIQTALRRSQTEH